MQFKWLYLSALRGRQVNDHVDLAGTEVAEYIRLLLGLIGEMEEVARYTGLMKEVVSGLGGVDIVTELVEEVGRVDDIITQSGLYGHEDVLLGNTEAGGQE